MQCFGPDFGGLDTANLWPAPWVRPKVAGVKALSSFQCCLQQSLRSTFEKHLSTATLIHEQLDLHSQRLSLNSAGSITVNTWGVP
jgi:hypothetical protein